MSKTQVAASNLRLSKKLPWWWVFGVLYCFSGFTSLAYEVLWSRMLSMQFGVSIFGVVLTVASFMLGLGAGSLIGVDRARRSKHPIVVLALLEITISLYALLLPTMLHTASTWMEDVSTHLSLSQWYLLQGAEALCLLVIPAVVMGAGFAYVLKIVRGTPITLGKIYGLNTLGGVLGALFPLWSMPVLGWSASINLIALAGLAIGAGMLLLARFDTCVEDSQGINNPQQRPPLFALLIYAGIGAGSIMLEIGWIRLYGMVMLRTEYMLGIILAVFLLGIALGSLLLPQIYKYRLSLALPFVVGFGVLLGLWLLPATSSWHENSQFVSFFDATLHEALAVGLLTLPITLVLGAWLPLLADHFGGVPASGLWFYGANCLGGAVGAMAACLVFIPLLGSTGVVALAGVLIAAFGFVFLKWRWLWPTFIFLLLCAWSLRNMPAVHQLLPKTDVYSQDLLLYEDAISLTHVVRNRDGQRVLLSDMQRMDASSDPAAVDIQMDQARLALLLHPAPRNVLFLGLGTGISMAGSRPFPDLQRTAVELSQGSIFASKYWFAPVNRRIADVAQINRDDARHFLSTTNQHYDVIVGDLFHPDLAGMGSLLSVQQFQRVRDHLSDNGVFVQWVALNQFDIETLRVVLRSFGRVFPHAQMYMDGMHLALVGPRGKLFPASVMMHNLVRPEMKEAEQATGNEGVWTWIGRYWGAIPKNEGAVQDEWLPYIEYKLPRARLDGNVNLVDMLSWLLQFRPDANTARQQLAIDTNDKDQFDRAYAASELAARAWIATLKEDIPKAYKLTWLAYKANPQDRWIANALADNMMQTLSQAREHGISEHEALQRILNIYPNHINALRALWRLERSEGNLKESERIKLRIKEISPLDSEVNAFN